MDMPARRVCCHETTVAQSFPSPDAINGGRELYRPTLRGCSACPSVNEGIVNSRFRRAISTSFRQHHLVGVRRHGSQMASTQRFLSPDGGTSRAPATSTAEARVGYPFNPMRSRNRCAGFIADDFNERGAWIVLREAGGAGDATGQQTSSDRMLGDAGGEQRKE